MKNTLMHVKNECVVTAVKWRWRDSQKCQHTSLPQHRIITQEPFTHTVSNTALTTTNNTGMIVEWREHTQTLP